MTQSLFTTETPSGVNNTDGTPGIAFAVSFMVAVAGTITGVRFFSTTTVSGTYTAAVWQVTGEDVPGPGTGTLLGSDVLVGTPAAGAWVTIPLGTPVAVTPGTLYRAGVHSSAGRYVNSPSVFGSPIVSGDLTAPANGTDPVLLGSLGQGTFTINAALAFPGTSGNTTNYFADIVFAPDGGGIDLTASLILPALQSSTVLAATAEVLAPLTLPALQFAAALAAEASLATALSLLALQGAAALAARSAVAAALTLPALRISAVLSIPTGPVEDTSSPSAPISTISKPVVITTISRGYVSTTGTRGGS